MASPSPCPEAAMRTWLIVFIALANGIAWWWLDAQRSLRLTASLSRDQHETPTAPDIPKLLLLSEAVLEPRAADPRPPEPEPPVAEIETVPPRPPEPPAQEPIAAETPSPAVGPEPEPKPEPVPAPAVETESAPPVAEATPADAVAAECLVLGGTTSRAQLMAWRDKLLAAAISIGENVEASTENQPSSYRVSLPAGETPRQKIAALRKAGIEALLVADGSDAPRISAGVFRVNANARQQQQRLIDLGYSAQVVPIQRPVSRFWMTVSGPSGLKSRVNALLRGADLGWRACPEAATGAATGTQDP